MQKNEDLGIDFSDMMDLDQLIDTDTGQLVGEDNVPPQEKETAPKEEDEAVKKTNENLIEVNVEEPESSVDDPNEKPGDENLLLNNKVLENISRALYEKGVISELDEEKIKAIDESGGAEVLIDLIKGEIQKNTNSYKESLPERIRKVIDNYEEGVPLDVLIGLESADTRLNSLTEDQVKDSEELQKLLISENLRRQGISDAKIAKRIQQFDDLNQLEEEALDALTESKEYIKKATEEETNKAKQARIKAEEARVKSLADLQKDIKATNQLIEGIKISDREKDIIYESMTKAVDKDSNGNPMNAVMVTRQKNPLGFEKLLHYYHSLGLFNIEDDGKLSPNISKIKAGAKASAMDDLNKAIVDRQSSSVGTPAGEPRANAETMKSNIDIMKRAFGKQF